MQHGLVALGDSITYGEGGIVLGVDGRSWALWLAMALDLPYSNYAVPGVTVEHVRDVQLPQTGDRTYDVGCLYIGVNDVRNPAWDAAAFEAGYATVLPQLAAKAERTLVLTAPLDLGRPPAGPKVGDLNAIVRRHAHAHGAAVADLSDLRGWRLVLPDAVHPTALGQLEIADRAARALGAPRLPSSLVQRDETRAGLARFARGYAREVVRDRRRRFVEGRRAR